MFGEENNNIDNKKLTKAIKVSGLEEFVANLEFKEDTIIGEGAPGYLADKDKE